MKRHNVLSISILVALISTVSVAQVVTLSQSVNNVAINAGSVACGNASATAQNGFFRSYDLTGIAGPIDIVNVRFAVETANHAQYPLTIRIYNDPTPLTIAPISGLTLLHSEQIFIPAGNLFFVDVPILAPVTLDPATDRLVVEVFHAASSGLFFPGSNALGQTGDSFFMAPACGLPEPTSYAAAGFPNVHLILDVDYVLSGTPKPYPGTGEDLQTWTRVGTGNLTTGWGQEIKQAAAGDVLTVYSNSPNGTFDNREILVLGELFVTGFPPTPIAPGVAVGGGLFFYVGATPSPLGPLLLPPEGLATSTLIPPGLAGISCVFQSVIIWLNISGPANGIYAAADAHEIQFI